MPQEIPEYEFTLNQASLKGDFSSMATVHNNNMKEIMKWISAIASQITTGGNGGQVINNEVFETLLSNNRTIVTLEENLQTSDSIVVDEYKLTRVNNPSGFPLGSSELVIVDMNTTRNTDFRKKLISVMDKNGTYIYPLVKTVSNRASISFDVGKSIDSIDQNNTNRKYILIS